MSNPTGWALAYLLFAITSSGVVTACASGAAGDVGGDDTSDPKDAALSVRMDSNISVMIDAPNVKLDGGVVVPDAFKPPPDAPPSSGICTNNSQCTVSGQCCLTLGGPTGICTPGTIVLGACIPIT